MAYQVLPELYSFLQHFQHKTFEEQKVRDDLDKALQEGQHLLHTSNDNYTNKLHFEHIQNYAVSMNMNPDVIQGIMQMTEISNHIFSETHSKIQYHVNLIMDLSKKVDDIDYAKQQIQLITQNIQHEEEKRKLENEAYNLLQSTLGSREEQLYNIFYQVNKHANYKVAYRTDKGVLNLYFDNMLFPNNLYDISGYTYAYWYLGVKDAPYDKSNFYVKKTFQELNKLHYKYINTCVFTLDILQDIFRSTGVTDIVINMHDLINQKPIHYCVEEKHIVDFRLCNAFDRLYNKYNIDAWELFFRNQGCNVFTCRKTMRFIISRA